MIVGGYVIVNIPGGFSVNSGAGTPISVSTEIIENLKQSDKPVYISDVEFTANGGTVSISGFTHHNKMAGVDTHYLGNFMFMVTGDSVTIEML